jgi:hypothetical protein
MPLMSNVSRHYERRQLVSETPNSSIAKGGLGRWLRSPVQRGLFVVGCIGLVPWFLLRLVRELWRSAGVFDYLHNVFAQPIVPWFEPGWWWYAMLEWHDWPVVPALIALALSMAWPHTGARVVAWVRGNQ